MIKRIPAVLAAAVTAACFLAGTACAGNVTGPGTADPRVLLSGQYECTETFPQMTATDQSSAGEVTVITRPRTFHLDVENGGTPGSWNEAYLSAGVNPDGYDSVRCDSWGYGRSYRLPVPVASEGELRAYVTMHTAGRFEGDAGFDLWLTEPGKAWAGGTVTSAQMQASTRTTEIMVWLNSPGIWRSQYEQFGWVRLDGRLWQVFGYTGHSARHPWDYIVFALGRATSRAVTFSTGRLDLSAFTRFAWRQGWVTRGALLQSVDAGFEWYGDPWNGTHILKYSLGGVN